MYSFAAAILFETAWEQNDTQSISAIKNHVK